MTLPRLAVQSALLEAEAAGLRQVADTLLTLSRQLEEERHRADVSEDHAAELRAALLAARLVAKDEFTARRSGLPLTEEMIATRILRYPWLRRSGGEEADIGTPNAPADRASIGGAASAEGPSRVPPAR